MITRWFNRRLGTAEDRSRELKHTLKESIQVEGETKNGQNLGSNKRHTYDLSLRAGEKGRKLLRSNIWRDIEWKISKADERDQFTDTRSPMNPKQDKYKTTPTHTVFKQWQAKSKEKNFKWARERRHVTFVEAWLFSRNYRSRKVMEWECKGKTQIGICNTHTDR